MAIRWSAWSLGLALLAGGADAFAVEFRILHSESIALRAEDLGTSSAARGGLAAGPLSFEAYGRQFDLQLEPNERLLRRLPASQRTALQQFPVYRGRIEGVADSWVRITRVGSELHGMFWDGSELYIIEPTRAARTFMIAPTAGAQSGTVVYRLSDTLSDLGPNFCTVLQPGEKSTALASYNALVAELRQSTALAAVPTGEMQVAVIGDEEFLSHHVTDAQAVALARMNNVDGIFSDQVGVRLTASTIRIFDATNDPFTDASSANALIDEVGIYKNNAANGINNMGVAHLMTGRNLDGTTVGIAFLSSICSRRFGVSLSQDGFGLNSTQSTLVAAHEIGHNFGAPHDDETGTACESTPPDFLMAAQLNGSNQFSACSLTEMQPEIDAAACIAPLDFSDAALSAPAAVTAQVDQNFSFTVTASSTGSQQVDGVMVTINLPAAITLQSATPSAGSCSSGAGAVTCDLGSIPGGSSRNINVTARGTQVGTFTSTDSVTAANDANAGNNAADVRLTINPPSSPPSNGGGGGGGALGALMLLSLLLAGKRRAVAVVAIRGRSSRSSGAMNAWRRSRARAFAEFLGDLVRRALNR